MTQYFEMLTPEQVLRVHEASLEILEQVGLLVRNAKARDILAAHGCRLSSDSEIVRFPRAVVEQYRASIPPTFTFGGRDPDFDRTLPGDRPVMVTGSSAPNIIDPLTGQERRARSEDLARIAHLVNELPGYDVFSISTLAEDAPPGMFSLTRFYTALKNCSKPVRGSGPPEDAEKILRLAYAVAGSEAPTAPSVRHASLLPGGLALTMDFDSTQMLIFFTERFAVLPDHRA
jgi:trimethylamine--corrinoid protein Co-methyltransferase